MANDIADLLLRIDASTEGLRRELKKAEDAVTGSAADIDKNTKKIDDSFEGMQKSISTSLKLVGAALAAMGVQMSVSKVVEYADAWQNATNQLKTVQKDTEDLADTQAMLMAISNESRAGFEDTANLYTRLSRSTESLNLSQQELIDLTETINKSFAVSGASANEASNAIIQLSQGLSAGALRGEEFNSVAEQSPILMQAIADNLKMTRGELRDFAADGGITAEIVVQSLQKASGEIDRTFSKMSATFEQNMTIAKNNMLGFVGSSEAVQSATTAAGQAVVFLSENIDTMANAAKLLAVVFAARLAPAAMATVSAYGASAAALIAKTSAMGAAATAATALRGAMMLLGGPAGVAVIAGVALYKLADAFFDSSDAADETAMSINGVNAALSEYNKSMQSADPIAQGLNMAIQRASLDLNTLTAAFGANSDEVAHHMRYMESLTEDLRAHQRAQQGSTQATNQATQATVVHTGRTAEQIAELRKSAVALDHGTHSTAAQTEAVNTLIDSLSVVRLSYAENIAMMNKQQWVMQGVTEATYDASKATDFWTAVAEQGAERRSKAEADAARVAQDNWQRTHEYLTDTLMSLDVSSGNVFENIADSFVGMVKRMVAEWAASGIMNLLGMGSGGTATNIIGGLLGGGGGLGSTIAGGIGKIASGGLGGIGSAVSGGIGSIGAAIGAIPGAGWAAMGVAAAAALLKKDPTYSGNAGLLISDVPGAKADQKFAVDPFESGFAPVGFARRQDQGAAMQYIESLRGIDSSLTAAARAAGLNLDTFKNNPFAGVSEKGTGRGAFLGQAFEDGKMTGVSFDQQATQFAKQWIAALGTQISDEDRSYFMGGQNVDDILARVAERTQSVSSPAAEETRQQSTELIGEVKNLSGKIEMLVDVQKGASSVTEKQLDDLQANDTTIAQTIASLLQQLVSAVNQIPAGTEVTR